MCSFKKSGLWGIVFILTYQVTTAQTHKTAAQEKIKHTMDSLQRLLKSPLHDSIKANVYTLQGNLFRKQHKTDQAI